MAEGGGIEPLGFTQPTLSRRVADHSAAPSRIWRWDGDSNPDRCYPELRFQRRAMPIPLIPPKTWRKARDSNPHSPVGHRRCSKPLHCRFCQPSKMLSNYQTTQLHGLF